MKNLGQDKHMSGGGFLKFNATVELKLLPLEVVALPFWTFCNDQKWVSGWRFTFRWLIFFIVIFKKPNE